MFAISSALAVIRYRYPFCELKSVFFIQKAYRELQKKFISDRKKEEECSGEYGLYYNPDRLDPDFGEEESDSFKHTTPQHRYLIVTKG